VEESRRNFFKKMFKKDEVSKYIRPPHSPKEDMFFLEYCVDCGGDCAKSCDENIIKIIDNTPQISFAESGCTYCQDCVDACKKPVLNLENPQYINAKVTLNILSCVAWQNVICSSCKDSCLDNAIQFLGLFRPEIDYDKCTNCGFCISTCPTQAFSI